METMRMKAGMQLVLHGMHEETQTENKKTQTKKKRTGKIEGRIVENRRKR